MKINYRCLIYVVFTGYGAGYNMLHKNESGLNYLPDGLEDKDFFTNCEDDDGGG